jgi:hypothetical protein
MQPQLMLLIVFMMILNPGKGQNEENFDTIRLENIRSHIPIVSSVENLMLCFGIPCDLYTHNQSTTIYMHEDNHTIEKIKCRLNQVTYFQKGISYFEKNGTVRLNYIDFKRNKQVFMSTEKIILSRALTLEELMQKYNYSKEDVSEPFNGFLAPYPTKKSDTTRCVKFLTGEPNRISIELYFDKTNHLRYMFIGANDF